MRILVQLIIVMLLLATASFGTALDLLQKPSPYLMAQEPDEFPNEKEGKDKPKVTQPEKPKDAQPSNANQTQNIQPTGKKKSMWKAAALSALLPGMGQHYLGHKSKARVFFAVEAASWISFASFRIYGHLKEDDMVNYAAVYAGAQLDGKSDEFEDLVGFYRDINTYNTFGRVFDTERPYLDDTPENHWYWTDTLAQANYRNMKNSAREAKRRSEFAIGVAVVSRLVSIIDAVRDARRQQRRIDDEFTDTKTPHLQLALDPLNETGQVKLTLFTGF